MQIRVHIYINIRIANVQMYVCIILQKRFAIEDGVLRSAGKVFGG